MGNRCLLVSDGVDIRVDGLDEAARATKDLANAIAAETLLEWTNRIESTVKQDCNEDIVFKGRIINGELNLEFKAMPGKVDCVINSIKKHLDSMHSVTRAWWEAYIHVLEAKKKDDIQSHSP
jgi:hypothetical protein